LLAGFRRRCRREQRHHGLAGADIALQQPQHPHRLAEIAGNGFRGVLLRDGQRIGQCIDDLAPQMAVAGIAHAGRPPQLRAHQRQRELAREQFVEGEARPERPVRQDVCQFDRIVYPVQRLGDGGKRAAPQHLGADPFRQVGELLQCLRHRPADRADGKPLG